MNIGFLKIIFRIIQINHTKFFEKINCYGFLSSKNEVKNNEMIQNMAILCIIFSIGVYSL